MVKLAELATVSPFSHTAGLPIIASEMQRVHRSQNGAMSRGPTPLLNYSMGFDWGPTGTEISPGGEAFNPIGSSVQPLFKGKIYIEPSITSLRAVMIANASALGVARVFVQIGSDGIRGTASEESRDFNASSVGVEELAITYATADTGTGWQDVIVEAQRLTAGTFELRTVAIATALVGWNASDPE